MTAEQAETLLLLTFRAAVDGGMAPEVAVQQISAYIAGTPPPPTSEETAQIRAVHAILDRPLAAAVDTNAPHPMPGAVYLK